MVEVKGGGGRGQGVVGSRVVEVKGWWSLFLSFQIYF